MKNEAAMCFKRLATGEVIGEKWGLGVSEKLDRIQFTCPGRIV